VSREQPDDGFDDDEAARQLREELTQKQIAISKLSRELKHSQVRSSLFILCFCLSVSVMSRFF
jgi:hypothetical protein